MVKEIQQTFNIYFDTKNKWVTMHWDGYVTSDQFREGTELMLNILIENRAYKVLADIKNMLLIDKSDQEWLKEYFLPRAMRFGFRAIALIKPDSYFNLAAIKDISKSMKDKTMRIRLFEDIDRAKSWLKKAEV